MDIGAQLRTAREAKGLSIGTVSQRTRVPARALSAIERNDRTALPPPAFSRGFVRTYAEEVDLDPESLVRDYFAQFPEQAVAPPTISVRKLPDASWQEPSRWGGMASAVAILLAVVVAAAGTRTAIGNGHRTDARRHYRRFCGTRSAGAGNASDRPSGDNACSAAPQASPSEPLTVVLSMSRPCWVAATVDGQRTIYRVLQGGETTTLAGKSAIAIRLGDAGAVKWTINGRDPGTPGWKWRGSRYPDRSRERRDGSLARDHRQSIAINSSVWSSSGSRSRPNASRSATIAAICSSGGSADVRPNTSISRGKSYMSSPGSCRSVTPSV